MNLVIIARDHQRKFRTQNASLNSARPSIVGLRVGELLMCEAVGESGSGEA
jgi:hypothetical protein